MAYECSEGVVRRRRHWPEAEKRRIVAEVGVDGRSLSDVGRRHGIHASLLGRWRDLYGAESDAAPSSVPPFVPVTVGLPEAAVAPPLPMIGESRGADVIEVVLAKGRRLIVAETIAPSRLRLLVAAIEAA